ncbi:uncharacterized protein LOC133399565 [Phycodurus eques]|uniref:uncharacterized protein LOC133399565 n=1 Tax=Phycodurus eques TaxID=693459 RepID=UPI002ACEC3BF|nr:uncharacterized protein LOC133399565 [Phycodurus eques]
MSALKGEVHLRLRFLLLLQLQLLSYVAVGSRTGDMAATLRGNLRAVELALCNLVAVERDYVQHIFNGNPPLEYKLKCLEPIPGITIPVGNSSAEVRAAICSINDYLGRHLPPIIGNLTWQHRDQLMGNASVFHSQFKAAVELTARQQRGSDGDGGDGGTPTECRRPIRNSHGYVLKKHGLRIIYYTRRWVEAFTSLQPNCDYPS